MLHRRIQEFVTRDGTDRADAVCTLAETVEQILRQRRDKKLKVVFDQASQTANLVVCTEMI